VLGFLLARRLLAAFGLRYFKRIQAYQSLALLLVLGIASALLANLALSPPVASDATAPLVMFATSAIYYGVVLAGCVLICLMYGSRANGQAEVHAALLTARALERSQAQALALAAGSADAARAAAACAAVIAAARDAVRHDLALDPVRIMGLPASYGLLQALSVGLISAFSASGRLLVSARS